MMYLFLILIFKVDSCYFNNKIGENCCFKPFRSMLLLSIRVYQNTFSKVQGDVCNFIPSCSHFGYNAIKKYGILKGLLLTSDRLQRCHPFAWRYLNKYYTLKFDTLRGYKLFDPVEKYK